MHLRAKGAGGGPGPSNGAEEGPSAELAQLDSALTADVEAAVARAAAESGHGSEAGSGAPSPPSGCAPPTLPRRLWLRMRAVRFVEPAVQTTNKPRISIK